MGCVQTCICCQRSRHLIISLLFLLVSSLTLGRFIAEGRAISKLVDYSAQNGGEEKVVVTRRLIGSSPPRCERRCSSCGHCEAIQVPVVPQLNTHMVIMSNGHHLISTVPTIEYARGDYISNYKPMCWKCKCGDLLFNP